MGINLRTHDGEELPVDIKNTEDKITIPLDIEAFKQYCKDKNSCSDCLLVKIVFTSNGFYKCICPLSQTDPMNWDFSHILKRIKNTIKDAMKLGLISSVSSKE